MRLFNIFKQDLSAQEVAEVRREVLAIALPAMGENALQMVLGLVDTAFLGYLNWQAMAAAGLANQVFFIFQAFLVAIATGSSVLVANAVGAKNQNAIRSATWNAIYLALILGLVITCFSLISSGLVFLGGAGASAEVRGMAASYLQINLLGGVVLSLMFVLSALLRGSGDTRSPLYASILANSLNALLDYILIFGKMGMPKMGIEGAALATVISRAVGLVILGVILFRSPRFQLRVKENRRFSSKRTKEILRVGLPTSMENFFFFAWDARFREHLVDRGRSSLRSAPRGHQHRIHFLYAGVWRFGGLNGLSRPVQRSGRSPYGSRHRETRVDHRMRVYGLRRYLHFAVPGVLDPYFHCR